MDWAIRSAYQGTYKSWALFIHLSVSFCHSNQINYLLDTSPSPSFILSKYLLQRLRISSVMKYTQEILDISCIKTSRVNKSTNLTDVEKPLRRGKRQTVAQRMTTCSQVTASWMNNYYKQAFVAYVEPLRYYLTFGLRRFWSACKAGEQFEKYNI